MRRGASGMALGATRAFRDPADRIAKRVRPNEGGARMQDRAVSPLGSRYAGQPDFTDFSNWHGLQMTAHIRRHLELEILALTGKTRRGLTCQWI